MKTAAIVEFFTNSNNTRSSRSLYLIPAAAVDIRIPEMGNKFVGAVNDMAILVN